MTGVRILQWNPERFLLAVVQGHAEAAALTTGEAKNNVKPTATWTGQLARSIGYTPTAPLAGEIGSTLSYARIHEEGGRDGAYAAKGYLRRAADGYPARLVAAVKRRLGGI